MKVMEYCQQYMEVIEWPSTVEFTFNDWQNDFQSEDLRSLISWKYNDRCFITDVRARIAGFRTDGVYRGPNNAWFSQAFLLDTESTEWRVIVNQYQLLGLAHDVDTEVIVALEMDGYAQHYPSNYVIVTFHTENLCIPAADLSRTAIADELDRLRDAGTLPTIIGKSP